jgi:hypothetical protein
MSAPEIAIRDAVVTALASVTGLSAERVIVGRPTTLGEGPTPPCVWVAVRSAQDAYGPDLTSYETTLLLDLYVLAPATSSSPANREDAILNLGFLVRAAIRALPAVSGVEMLAAPLAGLAQSPEAAQGTGLMVMVMEAQFYFVSVGV